jgi:hypothetical protein
MLVYSRAICFIICPEAVINIAIDMYKFTFAMCAVFSPLARVFGTIWPRLLTEAIAETAPPLSLVDCASFKLIRRSVFTGLISFVDAL